MGVVQKLLESKVTIITSAMAVAILTGCGASHRQAQNKIKTVDVPQTPIKSQGRVGFCWAYATVGLLENLMLKKTGVPVDLSEESLGFYRMAEELYALSNVKSADELGTAEQVGQAVFEGLEGWDLTFNPYYNPHLPVRNSLQLIDAYGIVPESAWAFKFGTDAQIKNLMDAVYAGFAEVMKANGQGHVTRDMVMNVLAAPHAFGSRPPVEFQYVTPLGAINTVKATGFAKDVIGFSVDDYTYMIHDDQIDYDKMVKAIKLTLARGIDVPLSYTIFADSFNNWDASYRFDNPQGSHEIDGGHAVLITDFVNRGGRPGQVSSAELAAEMAKGSDALDYLVIKNSWGTKYQSPLLRLPGYHTVFQSYVREIAKTPTDMTIVVPRDIAFQVRYNL
jgi:hypothetical protein